MQNNNETKKGTIIGIDLASNLMKKVKQPEAETVIKLDELEEFDEVDHYEGLSFSAAIEMLKNNPGAYMFKDWWAVEEFVVYQKGYPQGIPCNQQTAEAWGLLPGSLFRCEPYLQKQTYNAEDELTHVMWHPNPEELMTDDWMVDIPKPIIQAK